MSAFGLVRSARSVDWAAQVDEPQASGGCTAGSKHSEKGEQHDRNCQTNRNPNLVGNGAVGRLFVLELSGGRIHSMNPDGSDRKVIVTDCHLPDGIVVDAEAGHIYWTNMGSSPSANDGSIERADIDGKNRRVIVPRGGTFTPKQIQLDKKNGKLYWCDREGMRVMRVESRRLADRNARRDGSRRRGSARPDQVVRRDHHRSRAQADLLDAKGPGQWRSGPNLPRRARNPEG